MAAVDDMDDDLVDVMAVDDDEPQVMMAATPVEGAPAGQTSASPAPSSAVKPGGVPRAPGSSIEESESLLHKLREFVESKGGDWEEGWHVEVFVRQSGNSAGTKDAYYFAPSGKRFRSRQEVVKAMGLGRPPVPSPEAAYEQAQATLERMSLPLTLDSGAAVRSWGNVDRREGFHTAVQLWPCGYEAAWPESQLEGASYISRIQADEEAEGPSFTVTLRTADGQEQLISKGNDPNDAWDRAAARQKAALEAALAREKALKPVSAKKPKPKPGDDTAAAAENGAPGPATMPDALPAAAQADAATATAQPASAGAADADVPFANGIAHTAASQQSSPGATPAPDAAIPAVKPPTPQAPPASPAPPPKDLSPTDKLLVEASPLVGAWGEERYGFADASVLQALEGLPGADGLEAYEFVSRRTGGWEDERRRLQKEGDKRSRLASRGARGLEKGKGQLAKQQEKRKRAEDKANAPKKSRKGQPGTLDDWLGTSEGGAAAGPRDMPPLLLPRVPLPPLMLPSNEGNAVRPAKKRKGYTAADRDVEAIMLRMLKQVEAKCDREAAVMAKKAARDAEREAAKALSQEEKRFAREVKRCAKLGLPPPSPMPKPPTVQLQQQDRPLAAPKLAPFNSEDMLLPGAHRKPPSPEPLTQGIATPSALAAALAALELMSRFHKGFQLDPRRLPSPSQAEQALAAPADHAQNCLALHHPLVECVFYDFWSGATEVEASNNADMRANDVSGAYPLFKEESWPEIARRQFLLLEVAAMVKALDSSGGLGPAVGAPGSSSAHPLALMDCNSVLQTLLAGVKRDPRYHVAALPHTACPSAPGGLLATQDAEALAEAESYMQTVGNDGEANPDQTAVFALMRAGRRLLWTLINDTKCGKALCSLGANAAIASRLAMPLDLRMVAARLEHGSYGAGEEGLEAMIDDIKYVCMLWRVGCTKGKAFSRKQHDKRGADGAANVEAALPLAAATARQSLKDGEAGAQVKQEGEQADRKQAVVDDLSMPFVPWTACAGCWNGDDPKRIVICEGCEVEYHTYCLNPPLDEVPQGDWYCQRCHERGIAPTDTPKDSQLTWRTPGAHDYIRLSQMLGEREYEMLTTEQRGAVLGALEAIMLDTNFMRLTVAATVDTRREVAQELSALRARLRNEEREREEELKRAREAAAADAAAAAFARLESASPKDAKKKGGKKAAAAPADAQQPDAGGKGSKSKKRKQSTNGDAAGAAADVDANGDADAGAGALNDSADPADSKAGLQARGTRSKGDALESMASEADLAHMAALSAEIEELTERRVPLGWDRHWNRYWLLAGPRASAPRNRAPLVCVELRPEPGKGSPMEMLLSPQKQLQKHLPPDIAMAGAQWGCYTSPGALDGLLDWLNPKGQREGPLRRKVAEYRRTVPSPKAERDAAEGAAQKPIIVKLGGSTAKASSSANGAVGMSAGPDAAAAGPGTLAEGAAAVQTPAVEAEPSTPAKAAQPAAAQQAAAQADQAAPAQQLQPPAAAAEPKADGGQAAAPGEEEPPKVLKLRKALLALRNSMAEDIIHEVRGSDRRQAMWARLVDKASSPQDFMAAAVVLEHMVRREYLKPYWRLWCYPTPSPEDTDTLAAVWLRVHGLQGAVKKNLAARDAAVLAPPKAAPGRRKPPPRGLAAAHDTPVSSEQDDDSDADAGRAARGGRRGAGASRFADPPRRSTRATAVEDEDERAARELDAQLNGPMRGVVRAPRSTRGPPGRGEAGRRSLRSGSRTNSAANLQDADGYRSRLRGAGGTAGARPDYAYQAHIPSSDDEDAGEGAGVAGPNAGSSDSAGAHPADSEQQQSESDVDDDDAGLDAAGEADDDAYVDDSEEEAANALEDDEESSDDDDAADQDDMRPAVRRSGRNAIPAPAPTRGRTTRGRQPSAEPAVTTAVAGRKRLRKAG